MASSKIPRGIRNNNPLNIRTGIRWQGERENPKDKDFEEFETMAFGVRAAFIIIKNYIRRHKLTTPRQICARWAPKCENDTENYLKTVCRVSKLDPDKPVLPYSFQDMSALFNGMCMAEIGQMLDQSIVNEGFNLALGYDQKM